MSSGSLHASVSPGSVRAADHRRRWWRHGWFLLALVVGVALRAAVMVAYRPVLLFPDSFGYLQHAFSLTLQGTRPGGYSYFLWPIVHLTDARYGGYAVPAVQHLFGLLIAVGCYGLLVRRGLPGWGATLAVLPVLLDPLQLVLEHFLLSDTLFEICLVGACLTLLWKSRPGYPAMLASGLLLAGATLTRGAGSFLIVVFVIALLCLRVGWRKLVVFVLAAVIPLGGYAAEFHRQHGEYALSTFGARFLYARLAVIVRCDGVPLPSYEQPLCPSEPVGQRRIINWYVWGHQRGPQYQVPPPPGMTQTAMVKDFDKRVVRAEPWVYGRSVAHYFLAGFGPSRTTEMSGNNPHFWLFEPHYWLSGLLLGNAPSQDARNTVQSNHTAAAFLTDYRKHLWTPGPLLGLLGLVALVALLGFGRARWAGDRVAIGVLLWACLVPLATTAAVSGFSWRYQLPQIPLLPVAGALGIAALVRGRAPGRSVDPPLRLLDTAAARVAALPLPGPIGRSLARGRDRGVLQWCLAALTAAFAGAVAGAGAAVSGWSNQVHAAAGGALVAAFVLVLLLVSRSHAAAAPGPTAGTRSLRR